MEKEKRILVLDDDPVVGLSCKRILGAEGYVVTTVAKGEDAIKRLSTEEFDVLISDVRLPDIYGIDVLRETRQIQPKTDVVIITGYPTLEDAKEAISLILRKSEVIQGEDQVKLRDIKVSSTQTYESSAVDFKMMFLLEFQFEDDVSSDTKVAVIKSLQEYFDKA